MDRRFKERLIGAVVLAGAAVLILPAVLKGPRAPAPEAAQPDPTAMHTETIELEPAPRSRFDPGEKSPATTHKRDAPAAVPPAPAGESSPDPPEAAPQPQPAGSAAATADATPGAEATTAPPAPAAAPPAAAPSPSSAPVAAGARPPSQATTGWAVQVGTFASSSNATALAAKLEARGYSAFVAPLASGGKTLFRVRVGPAPDIDTARTLERRLEKEGQAGDVVRQP